MSRTQPLYRLQELDSTINHAQARIKVIMAILGEDEVLQRAIQDEQAAKHVLKEKQKDLKKAENKVEDQQSEIKQKTKILYGGGVTNPKELEDLQEKVTSLQRYLGVLEERQLEAMLESEDAKEVHTQTTQTLDEIRAELEDQHKELNEEKTELERLIETSREKRPSFLSIIPPEDIELYEKLRKSRAGIAITAICDKSCGACGTHIPSAIYQIARSPSQIGQCSACRRILHEIRS